ncbi:hypothetical protein BLNAU_9012 [Blattamonas nauphoetae]|uniref:Uncharacterized protein n=1 Tax=Blattamonas nauphoetae TaxID=2049346 RepID=A0ABQ9XX36_9EUKA|nr:hypothetical protein BLNAU_9012 [Blattamonas nauphoetae]
MVTNASLDLQNLQSAVVQAVSSLIDHLSRLQKGEEVGLRAIMLSLRSALPLSMQPPIPFTRRQVDSARLRTIRGNLLQIKKPSPPNAFFRFWPIRHLMIVVSFIVAFSTSSSEKSKGDRIAEIEALRSGASGIQATDQNPEHLCLVPYQEDACRTHYLKFLTEDGLTTLK